MDDLAETESEVGKNVLGRDDVEDGQVGDRGQSVRHRRKTAIMAPDCKPQPPVMLFRSVSGLAMVRSVSKPSPVPRIFTLP